MDNIRTPRSASIKLLCDDNETCEELDMDDHN